MEPALSSLTDLFAVLAVVGLLGTVTWLVVLVATISWLRRRNRVAPRVASPTPLRWLVSPGWAARLHRELRRSARLARDAADRRRPSPLSDLADDLVRQAVLIDAELVASAALPPVARWASLTPLAQRTAVVSATAARLSGLANRLAAGPDPGAELTQLTQRLDLLIRAHADLDRLERTPVPTRA